MLVGCSGPDSVIVNVEELINDAPPHLHKKGEQGARHIDVDLEVVEGFKAQ